MEVTVVCPQALSDANADTHDAPYAFKVLENLLKDISENEDRGYQDFIERIGQDIVQATLTESLRSPVHEILTEGVDFNDIDALNKIGGDIDSLGEGWYMDVVSHVTDLERLGLYTGQSIQFKERIREHKRKIPAGKTLHHFYANQDGAQPTFVILGSLHPLLEMNDVDKSKLLNIGETWLALCFRTLPKSTLEAYLGPIDQEAGPTPLNIANPLNQNHGSKATAETSKMKESNDPLVQQYWKETIVPQMQENFAKARDAMKAQEYKPIIEAKRKGSTKTAKTALKREPETEAEQHVMVHCARCQSAESVKEDAAPQYETATGCYIVRGQRCPTCPPATNGKKRQTPFEPVDTEIQIVQERQLARVYKKAKKY